MATNGPLLKRKGFFRTVLAFNLLQYLSIIYTVTDLWKHDGTGAASPGFYVYVSLFGVVLPALLMHNAHALVRDYFPAKRIGQRFRIWTIWICILQLLGSTLFFFSSLYVFTLFNTLPKDAQLTLTLIAISFLSAALLNIITAILLLRTMSTIRKKYRDSPWESFESA